MPKKKPRLKLDGPAEDILFRLPAAIFLALGVWRLEF
jgi:hypothetical protein